jgi:two-component system osmolarity sensor histidine kinase EnvZ
LKLKLNGLPESLFGRTAAALLAAFLLFEAIAFGVVWFMVIQPLAERSADDLAAKILLSAQTWVELPPQTRADFEMELAFRHDLALAEVSSRLPKAAEANFMSERIAAALSRRANQNITLKRDADPQWDWLEIQIADKLLRVGFDRQRYALNAPLAAVGVILLGALLTVLTALFMASRTSQRLKSLARKAADIGQGRAPELLPETGARELRELTTAFNHLAEEVQALLENRTVLLAGVSHDLRTPITRLRLALSLLEDGDAKLIKRMEHDLDEMNRLITDMLLFARSLKIEALHACNVTQILDDLAAQAALLGPIEWHSGPAYYAQISEAALRRIVSNLLDNARRYSSGVCGSGSGNSSDKGGAEAPVTLTLTRHADRICIAVLDRGPGIPSEQREAVFRPFTRLETSRNRDAGGSGLGLAIARQLADTYGWRIELSERKGGGLVASVILRLC